MAAAVNGNSWGYSDDRNGAYSQPRQNNDPPRSYSSQGARRRTSDYDIRSDTDNRRRATSRSGANSAMKKRSKDKLREKLKEPVASQNDGDDSKWIHRDKLAAIEIKEMEEAGFYVGRSRRAASTDPGDHGRTSRSTSRKRREVDDYDQYDEYGRKRMSTIPGAEEEEYQSRGAYRDTEYEPTMVSSNHNSVEEGSLEKSPASRGHRLHGSNSRIPIVKNGTSPPSTGDANKPRSRNGSVGSSAILDDMTNGKREGSPPKGPAAKKAAVAVNGQKSASPAAAARPGSSHGIKPRQLSNSASKRPGSSSGHKSRPSTSHAPEGDPPWMNSMFKPDPRLPPDQQMLPTHAKRMMQEQWAKEGKPSTVYDRDFNQLTDEELRNMVPPSGTSKLALDSPIHSPVAEVPEPMVDVPRPTRTPSPFKNFPSQSPEKSDSASLRPGTSGGYRITPTITTPPPILPSPRNSNFPPTNRQSVETALQSPPPTRMPELDEKQEAEPKKGCCCVMM